MAATFEQWLAKVDTVLERRVGLSHGDLADIAYHDLFDDGVSPAAAAREALFGEGFI